MPSTNRGDGSNDPWAASQAAMEGWLQAQRALWDGWSALMTGGDRAKSADPTGPATTLLKQWQKLMTDGMAQFGLGNTGTQAFAGAQDAQRMMLQFWETTTAAWSDMADAIENARDWQAVAQRWGETFARQTVGGAPGGFTLPDAAELQRQFDAMWAPFQAMWQGLAATPADFDGGLWQMMRQGPAQWQGANLGLNREFNHKLQQAYAAWVDVQEAQATYQNQVARLWAQSYQRFLERLVARQQAGEPVESARALLMLWSESAETLFDEAFRTDAYVEAQAALLNNNLRYRQALRAVGEVFQQVLDMPTRTEVDEAHRRIYELNKAMKALKRQLDALQGAKA